MLKASSLLWIVVKIFYHGHLKRRKVKIKVRDVVNTGLKEWLIPKGYSKNINMLKE